MSNEIGSFSENLAGVPKMKFGDEYLSKIAFDVYKPSIKTGKFKSELNRNLYAEAFYENNQEQYIPRLEELCVAVLANNLKLGGASDSRIRKFNEEQIGELIDIDIPLKDVIELENQTFWRRLSVKKCKDNLLIYQKLHDPNVKWKAFGVSLKYAEVLETTKYEDWNEDIIADLSKLVSPYVTELYISTLVPMQEHSVERNSQLANFAMVNVPDKDCHHGNLDCFQFLSNLKELRLEFQPPTLNLDYKHRYFNLSLVDIHNLSKGLKCCKQLEVLKIARSKIGDKNLDILVNGIMMLPLKILNFSYCNLNDECGSLIAKLLMTCLSIKHLELEGNYLSTMGMEFLSNALSNYGGSIDYLGLAHNPITDKGVLALRESLKSKEQCSHLNLTAVDVSDTGIKLILELILEHKPLRKLEVGALSLGYNGGEKLIECLESNTYITMIECRECDLTQDQMIKIKVLLKRNNYYNDNPGFREKVSCKEEEAIMDAYASRVKNSVLLNAMQKIKNIKANKQNFTPKLQFSNTIPPFIVEAPRKEKSNLEILNGCFGNESEMSKEYVIKKEPNGKNFVFDPNSFSETEILNHIIAGQMPKRKDRNFFKNYTKNCI